LRERHNYRVYFMASRSRVLYIGVTNNLGRRVWEHQNNLIECFTKQYRCHRLVYFESFDRVENAIQREKQLKRWNRAEEGCIDRTRESDMGRLVGGMGQPIEQQVPPRAS
jgi:putative endonuclease